MCTTNLDAAEAQAFPWIHYQTGGNSMRLSALRSSHGLAIVIACLRMQWREQNIIKYRVPTLEARYAVDVEHCLNHDHAIAVATPNAFGLLTVLFCAPSDTMGRETHIPHSPSTLVSDDDVLRGPMMGTLPQVTVKSGHG